MWETSKETERNKKSTKQVSRHQQSCLASPQQSRLHSSKRLTVRCPTIQSLNNTPASLASIIRDLDWEIPDTSIKSTWSVTGMPSKQYKSTVPIYSQIGTPRPSTLCCVFFFFSRPGWLCTLLSPRLFLLQTYQVRTLYPPPPPLKMYGVWSGQNKNQ